MTTTEATRADRVAFGIVLILASVTAMAFADAMVKYVSSDLTVWQVFAARSLFAIPCLLLLVRAGLASLKPLSTRWVLLRSLALVGTWLAFYASLPVLNLSVAAVAVYTNPILTTLMTALWLGEPVTRRQWLGVLIGFAGVVVILRPGSEAFSWYVLLPLLAAALYSLSMVITRARCQQERAVTLALGLHGAFLATGLVATVILALAPIPGELRASQAFLLAVWEPMGLGAWGLMAFLGVLSAGFFLGVARAYQIAPPQVIATFDYGYLVSAALWGFVFFAERPDGLTVLGMALIASAGLLISARSGGD